MNENINDILENFFINPYDEKYCIDYSTSNLHKKRDNKKLIIYSKQINTEKTYDYNFADGDIGIAVKNLGDKELSCYLTVNGVLINTFNIKPFMVEWLLNGTPMFLINIDFILFFSI